MKTLLGFLCFLSLSGAHASNSIPQDDLFDKAHEQAMELGYYGHDVTICMDTKLKQVYVGGVSQWNAPLQIFLVQNSQAIAVENKNQDLKVKDTEFTSSKISGSLNFIGDEKRMDGYVSQEAFLTIHPFEVAPMQLVCFTRNSGLE